jgi:hypothetical protein
MHLLAVACGDEPEFLAQQMSGYGADETVALEELRDLPGLLEQFLLARI